ncbi:TIM-barrel domain-containing protein [Salibacterium halotolerans]|uniref:Alpha-glucosidase n=1 Tax=Salibacterium halotolerans TaxID=1884432 RepID=A0A1I5XAI2_9BACI|nr:glycoside hydrolase family 31 protein [Salibacterium halotolerans]SFQ28856.1 alpha-glucosidase [Salibacterium halotolerans]
MNKKAHRFHWQLGEETSSLRLMNAAEDTEILIWILEENIFRIYIKDLNEEPLPTWSVAPGMEDVPYEGRRRLDVSPFTNPVYSINQVNDDEYEVLTSRLKLNMKLDSLQFIWYEKQNGVWSEIARDRDTQSYNLDETLGSGRFHYMKRKSEDMFFGLGEKAGPLNRHGHRYRMQNMDPMGYDPYLTDPLYKHIPFFMTRTKDRQWYGIFYDNLSTSVFDMGKELDNYHGYYRYYHAESGPLDYYMISGRDAAEVVETYSWLTGQTAFFPKWSLGYSGSTMTYTDAPDAQVQMNQFIRDAEAYEIPCQSFQLSSGYTSIDGKRYVFNWNTSKFPDPAAFASHYKEHGVNLCANIKPALLQDHPLYEELREKGYFVKNREGGEEELVQFWDDLGAYIDFTNPDAAAWWKEKVKEQLLSYGIESTWNDNNEFEIWDGESKLHGFGNGMKMKDARPVLSLLMTKTSLDAQKEYTPSARPYAITRSGGPGLQRYAQTWSGDNYTSWDSLKYNVLTGVGLSLSGVYNFGHDVGGFAGGAPEPELFIRWIQNGIVHPRFTIHSWNDDGSVNVPWMYPEYIEPIKRLMDFRETLIPYLYQLMKEAHDHYKPMIRPMFYSFSHDEKTFEESYQFMLGKDVLVAPVVEKGMETIGVYLPVNGKGWYDWHTGAYYNGGQTITVDAPMDRVPLFAQAGSIIPVDSKEDKMQEGEQRGYLCFPLQESGAVQLRHYEDDGASNDYKEDVYTINEVNVQTSGADVEVKLHSNGSYNLSYRDVTLYFPGYISGEITLNGEKQSTSAGEYTIPIK